MIQSLTNRCNTTNKDLKNELRTKQKESQQKQRLNSRKAVIDKTREDARNFKTKSDDLKTWVANKAKELLGYEQQQKITRQALDRESSQIAKE